MSTKSDRRSAAVRGSVHYAVTADRQLFHYAYAPHGTEETNIEFAEHTVEIRDVRRSPQPLRLEVEGASLLHHRSAVQSFYDGDELRCVGYPETAELVRSVTGAADVVVFDHNIRHGGQRGKMLIAGDVKHSGLSHPHRLQRQVRARPGLPPSSARPRYPVDEWRLSTFGGRSLSLCETARLRYATPLRSSSGTSSPQIFYTRIARDRSST